MNTILRTGITVPHLQWGRRVTWLTRIVIVMAMMALMPGVGKAANPQYVYFAGTFNDWKNFNQLKVSTENSNTYTGSVYFDANTDYQFKLKTYDTNTSTVVWHGNDITAGDGLDFTTPTGDANVTIKSGDAGTYSVTAVLGTDNKWTVTIKYKDNTYPTTALADYTWGDFYLTGSIDGETKTTDSNLKLTKTVGTDNTFQLTYKTTLNQVTTQKIKFVSKVNFEDVTFDYDYALQGGSSLPLTEDDATNKNICFTSGESGVYLITVNVAFEGNKPTFTVSVIPPYYTLTYYNGDNVMGIVDYHVMDGKVAFAIPSTAYVSGQGLKFSIRKNYWADASSTEITHTYYSVNTESITGSGAKTTLTTTDGTESGKVTFTAATGEEPRNIVVTFTPTESSDNVVVTYLNNNEVKAKTCYLMIRKAGQEDFKQLKMQTTRNRVIGFTPIDASYGSSAEENYMLQNINLKADDLSRILGTTVNANDNLEWFIQLGETATSYFYPKGESNVSYDKMNIQHHPDSYISSYNDKNTYGKYSYYDVDEGNFDANKPSVYYTFNKGVGVSYTFMAVLQAGNIPNKVGFVYNSSMAKDEPSGGYYLVGNFTNARGDVKIDAKDTSHPMTRYYYYGGAAYTDTQWDNFKTANNLSEAVADSIVYRAHVEKPTNGWGDLYIAVMPSNDQSWDNGGAIRPQINADYNGNYGYQVDSRATAGGLTTGNRNQSLNPDLKDIMEQLGVASTDEIGSYEFSMNITTTTYRLVFKRKATLVLKDWENVTYTNAKGVDEKRVVDGRGNYKYFNSFSSMIAYKKPSGVDAYVLNSFTPATEKTPTTLVLKKLTESYLPANVGLVLAMTATDATSNNYPVTDRAAHIDANDGTTYNTISVDLESYTTNESATTEETDYLTPLYDAQPLSKHFYDKDGKAIGSNYLFGFYNKKYITPNYTKSGNGDYALGFFISMGSDKSFPANSCYLHLLNDQAKDMEIGTDYDMSSSSATNAKPAGARIIFMDGDTPTGIYEINVNPNTDKESFYTLGGIRIDKPSQPGIYIHNGKKMIIK